MFGAVHLARPLSSAGASASAASAVTARLVDEYDGLRSRVAIPRPETHLIVRFGDFVPGGLDVHAIGGRQRVHRKLVPAGRTLTARLRLGASESVLGVPASAIAGRIVPLDSFWGDAATGRLLDRLASARSPADAANVLASAVSERELRAKRLGPHSRLVVDAAERLARTSVNAVADELGISERHLRRIFREATGVSPKTFAKLLRFRRALHAARDGRASWASIAAATGYYDQAHLIDEFRSISGATPRALLGELGTGPMDLLDDRDVNAEGGPFSRFALHRDEASRALHDR